MNAVYYHGVENFEVLSAAPIADVGDHECPPVGFAGLIGESASSFVGCEDKTERRTTRKGEFIAQFPLIPGHEIVGTISKLGKAVSGFEVGDRVVADPGITCDECFYCRRGNSLLCLNFKSLGVTQAGGFADYVNAASKKVYKIHNLTDEEATLVEPAACAVHGADKLALPVGAEVLICGAGPTGLILAQLLKLNGAANLVVIAANKGVKTRLARELDAADEYVEMERDVSAERAKEQWAALKARYPYGFDAVVEATGSEAVANECIHYVRRGGTLMVYGVYANEARVHWPPSKIFRDEIRIIGSFAQAFCFPRAVAYLDSGKIRVKGMVTDIFPVAEYQKALDKLESKTAVKIVNVNGNPACNPVSVSRFRTPAEQAVAGVGGSDAR
ncbi:Zinc-binding dehydrogenase [Mycena kentingensis (nom. inval.)]|nr:Zinc-binding dehydrogenase [Mycena kentingensis (nom. inval.)]